MDVTAPCAHIARRAIGFQYPLCRVDGCNLGYDPDMEREKRAFSTLYVGSMDVTRIHLVIVRRAVAFQYPLCRVDGCNTSLRAWRTAASTSFSTLYVGSMDVTRKRYGR